jgi:hypothetical protein
MRCGMKEAYIEKINQAMNRTEDLALLDLIFQLLAKSEEVAK